MPSTINATPTSSGLISSADNSGVLALQTGGTTAVTINGSQGVSVVKCLGVGNATPSTSGAGITFPATQSASSDANTLDDYEEGTWTPANSQGVSMTKNSASYTKTGRMVTVTFDLTVSANSNNNNFIINNLPFTPSFNSAGSLGYCEATTGSRITSDTGAFSIYTTGNAILTCITLSGLRFWGSLTYPAST